MQKGQSEIDSSLISSINSTNNFLISDIRYFICIQQELVSITFDLKIDNNSNTSRLFRYLLPFTFPYKPNSILFQNISQHSKCSSNKNEQFVYEILDNDYLIQLDCREETKHFLIINNFPSQTRFLISIKFYSPLTEAICQISFIESKSYSKLYPNYSFSIETDSKENIKIYHNQLEQCNQINDKSKIIIQSPFILKMPLKQTQQSYNIEKKSIEISLTINSILPLNIPDTDYDPQIDFSEVDSDLNQRFGS